MLGYCEAVEVPDFNMFFTQSGRYDDVSKYSNQLL
jgi:hypothetical protein